MRMRLILVSVIAILMLTVTAAAQDATSAWNSVAASYNFSTAPVGTHTTFSQAYSGSDFNSDFAALKAAVSQILGSTVPGTSGDDLMNYNIANWPN